MNAMRTQAIAAAFVIATLVGGCSASATETTSTPAPVTQTSSAPATGSGTVADFCAAYSAAGGDAETPGVFNFQGGTAETLELLKAFKQIQDSVTPPTDIAPAWGEWVRLTNQGIEVVSQLPDSEAISDAQVQQISESMLVPATEIRVFLAGNCG